MGLRQWLGFDPSAPAASPVTAQQQYLVGDWDIQGLIDAIMGMPVEKLWRDQPHLRTVVGFIARNIAQLGLHVFERDPATDGRNRMRDTPLAILLEQPNAEDTTYELIYATIASLMVYDKAYWYYGEDISAPSGWSLRHIPNVWVVNEVGGTAFAPDVYQVALPRQAASMAGRWLEVPRENMLVFKGWNPLDTLNGTSPVHALKSILAEQIAAQTYRQQVWKRGGRAHSVISRPAEAPPWSDTAKAGFKTEWQSMYAGDGSEAGGTPILEDGMTINRLGFNAKEEQFVEGAKLSLETCAQVYYINPTMIGVLENANYANVREFRRAVYGDTLGPPIEQLQQRINRFLVPRLATTAAKAKRTYVEFNLGAKLQGSFEEQAAVLQTAIGGPYMTQNEGRSKVNLPAVDGGDKLIEPLNITKPGDHRPIPAADGPNPPQSPPEGQPNGQQRRNGRPVNA